MTSTSDHSMLSANSRLPDHNEHEKISRINGESSIFRPNRVLILTKLTRLEYERRTNSGLNKSELEQALKSRGSDYLHLLERHNQHKKFLNVMQLGFGNENIECKVVHRWDYTDDNIKWADAVFTAGGDGTFLLAASKIHDRNKPVIGVNSDPVGSEGYMCLMKKQDETHFNKALRRLLDGDFNWMWRQRIRITMRGKNAFSDPIELHDQQLHHPEHRWSELHNPDHRWTETEKDGSTKLRSVSVVGGPNKLSNLNISNSSCSTHSSVFGTSFPTSNLARTLSLSEETGTNYEENGYQLERQLPVLALNEVFVGESLSSRVSYYELMIDDGDMVKQKSSGITVCTGTGSTSWYFNINKMTDMCVGELIDIISDELNVNLSEFGADREANGRICRRFNEQLLFPFNSPHIAYTVRDPVYNATFSPVPPRGFANKIRVKSRCFDAHLVVDGGLSYIFNDGSEAILELNPADALRTIVFR